MAAAEQSREALEVVPKERRLLFAALDSFRQYRQAAHYNITHRRRQNFYALPSAHWQMLAAPPFNIQAKFDRVDDAIDSNAEIATAILRSGLESFDVSKEPVNGELDWKGTATPNDMEKAKSTIRQFHRDWSGGGAAERDSCYGPILSDLQDLFPGADRSKVKVLIPGAGLGRLVFEVCKLGFDVEGNEISFHQLISSNWILNHVDPGEQFELYPAALTFSNQLSSENQLNVVKIPDIHPGLELNHTSKGHASYPSERMAMTAADFLMLYSDEEHKGTFDSVVTVFFIDTAPNLIRYIEVIHSTLVGQGYWINLGPLLWHFEERSQPAQGRESNHKGADKGDADGIAEPGSVELTSEEVLLLVEKMGFEIVAKEIREDGYGYIQDRGSMMQSAYKTSHFIAKKLT